MRPVGVASPLHNPVDCEEVEGGWAEGVRGAGGGREADARAGDGRSDLWGVDAERVDKLVAQVLAQRLERVESSDLALGVRHVGLVVRGVLAPVPPRGAWLRGNERRVRARRVALVIEDQRRLQGRDEKVGAEAKLVPFDERGGVDVLHDNAVDGPRAIATLTTHKADRLARSVDRDAAAMRRREWLCEPSGYCGHWGWHRGHLPCGMAASGPATH
mmetsp:Transcript_49778/g.111909  ORF Transcript_49778/g.111909 Transcript_49778/m.111909 type:complete len:216 (-) Transcript_49778:127-774(-)